MVHLEAAQPNPSLRKVTVVIATTISDMSVYAQMAIDPKEETATVTVASVV